MKRTDLHRPAVAPEIMHVSEVFGEPRLKLVPHILKMEASVYDEIHSFGVAASSLLASGLLILLCHKFLRLTR